MSGTALNTVLQEMIDTKIEHGIVLFRLAGRLNLEKINDLDNTFTEYINKDFIKYIINMVDVSDISSSGIGKIFSIFKKLDLVGGYLALSELSAVSEYVLDLARLADVFPIYNNDRLAIESYKDASRLNRIRIP